jgi:hypothetical protein
MSAGHSPGELIEAARTRTFMHSINADSSATHGFSTDTRFLATLRLSGSRISNLLRIETYGQIIQPYRRPRISQYAKQLCKGEEGMPIGSVSAGMGPRPLHWPPYLSTHHGPS